MGRSHTPRDMLCRKHAGWGPLGRVCWRVEVGWEMTGQWAQKYQPGKKQRWSLLRGGVGGAENEHLNRWENGVLQNTQYRLMLKSTQTKR